MVSKQELKILIADDEVSIIQLIRKLISPDIAHRIVGETTDGISALSMIEEVKPDIVITDIRMPGLNGIELIREAKERGFLTEFVIVSGYKDFSYAKAAIKYGVSEYLLKPIKADELNAVLQTVLEKRGETEKLKTRIADMEQTIVQNRIGKRRAILECYVRQLEDVSSYFHVEQEDNFRQVFDVHDGIFSVLIVKLDTDMPEETHVLIQNLELLGDKFYRLIKTSCYDGQTYCCGSRCYLLFHTSKQGYDKILEDLEIMMNHKTSQYNLYQVTVAVGSSEYGIQGITQAFLTADYALMQRFTLGKERLIVYDRQPVWQNLKFLSTEMKLKLDKAVYEYNARACAEILKKIYLEVYRQYKRDAYYVKKYLDEAAEYIELRLNEKQSQYIEPRASRLRVNLIQQSDFCTSCESLMELYINSLSNEIEKAGEEQKDGLSRPIKCMKQYIKEHFASNLSLDEIAGAAELSNAYGSSIFKKETGMTITNYLIQVRMEEAQRLLRETNLTINEVGYKVGYLDARYFSKLFIRVVGVKPVDYRKFYNG